MPGLSLVEFRGASEKELPSCFVLCYYEFMICYVLCLHLQQWLSFTGTGELLGAFHIRRSYGEQGTSYEQRLFIRLVQRPFWGSIFELFRNQGIQRLNVEKYSNIQLWIPDSRSRYTITPPQSLIGIWQARYSVYEDYDWIQAFPILTFISMP